MCQLDCPGQIPTSPISSAFSVRYFSLAAHMCQLDCPGQIPTSPISSAFSGRYFSLAAHMCQLDFRCQIPTSPISSALTRRRASRHWRSRPHGHNGEGNRRETQREGTNEKMRNVTFMVGKKGKSCWCNILKS